MNSRPEDELSFELCTEIERVGREGSVSEMSGLPVELSSILVERSMMKQIVELAINCRNENVYR